jgi:hypothetical protein
MIQDIDSIISLMKEYTFSDKKGKGELGEQDAAGAGTSNTNKRGSNWDELYALVRGKANMLGKKGEKWQSGVKRGVGNQVW